MITIFLMVDKDTGRISGWGSTRGSENDVEMEVQEDHEVLKNPFIYKLVEGELVRDSLYQLNAIKNAKSRELSIACKESILSGFNHTINGVEYHFSFDTEAQLNFQGSERLLTEGIVSEVMWTVTKDGEYDRIPINKAIMDELIIVILQHKNNNISKYRDVLLPQVENAQTIEEVNAIKW